MTPQLSLHSLRERIHRVRRYDIADLSPLDSEIFSHLTAIIDLENTVVPYGSVRHKPATEELLTHLELKWFRDVQFVTNSRSTDLAAMVHQVTGRNVVRGAHKPFTSRHLLGTHASPGALVVIGDQVLTDGLLAWRLRCPFIQLQIGDGREPVWPSLLRWFGTLLSRFLFDDSSIHEFQPTHMTPGRQFGNRLPDRPQSDASHE
jgi:predicted HAD superfamily phosphohydrolase YqeG